MNNSNPFGIVIPTDEDLMNARASSGARTILESGVYYATISGMTFKMSKSELPMAVVDYSVIVEETNQPVVLQDYWLLASKNEYKPSVYRNLAGLQDCWSVPKEMRTTQYFTWAPSQAGQDPAQKLMSCILNYRDIAKTNTSYVSKLMVRLNIDKIEGTYTDAQTGIVRESINNSIKSFVALDGVQKAENQQTQETKIVEPSFMANNRSFSPFDNL